MKHALLLLILYGITASLCLLLCLRDFLSAGEAEGMRVLLAFLWTGGFFFLLAKYLRQR